MFFCGYMYCQRFIGLVITFFMFMSRYAGGINQQASSSNTEPTWNFLCVREIENARREKIKRMGATLAGEDDLRLSAEKLGVATLKAKAYLATLSEDSD
jgi:hypothetical protein